jgi:hypothetical protein
MLVFSLTCMSKGLLLLVGFRDFTVPTGLFFVTWTGDMFSFVWGSLLIGLSWVFQYAIASTAACAGLSLLVNTNTK